LQLQNRALRQGFKEPRFNEEPSFQVSKERRLLARTHEPNVGAETAAKPAVAQTPTLTNPVEAKHTAAPRQTSENTK